MGRQLMLCRWSLSLLLSLSLLSAGCFTEQSDPVTFDEEDLLLEDELTTGSGATSSVATTGPQSSALLPGLSEPTVHSLVKRVTQTLSQSSADGLETSQAQLAAWFDVRVELIGGGDSSYRVSYHRITYSHKLPGESLSYDSSSRTTAPPISLGHLADLSRSGFAFRTTGGGTALELTEVPATVYGGDLKGPAAAEFIADQIGLVLLGRGPGQAPTAPAPRTRHIETPVPMDFSTRYSIKGTGQGTITLDMLGSVSSRPETTRVQLVGGAASVKLGGGHAFGEMTVDLASGVPLRADWNRYIEISLKTDLDERIEQRKHEVITIRAADAAAGPTSTISPSVAPSTAAPLQPAGVGRSLDR